MLVMFIVKKVTEYMAGHETRSCEIQTSFRVLLSFVFRDMPLKNN